jgi:hypothetical protein
MEGGVGCGKGKNASTPNFGADNGYPEGVGPGAGTWGGATGESGDSRAGVLSANSLADRRSFQPLRINTKCYLSTEG